VSTRTLIVFCNSMWGSPLHVPADLPAGCELSSDPRRFFEANAVVFHIPSLPRGALPPKRPGQLWVAWSIECEVNYPQLRDPGFMRSFDLTMTYRRDADIKTGYVGYFGSAENMERALRRPPSPKDADRPVAMFISSQTDRSGRREYARELARHIPIDSYGRLMRNRTLPHDDWRPTKLETIAHYKFTLAFENAIGEDYVTEKFFDPLVTGTVPIYLGAPNVETFAPGERSYINVNDFESPRALAEYLWRLSRDDAAYAEYLAWRSRPFRSEFLRFLDAERTHAFIRLCRAVRAAAVVAR
jgi:hypothetical protein